MNNNKKQQNNLKELKNLSYLVPKNKKQDFKNLVNLFELGLFQNVKTCLNLAQRLASRGEGPVKAIEKINAMQSAYIKSQTKTIKVSLTMTNQHQHKNQPSNYQLLLRKHPNQNQHLKKHPKKRRLFFNHFTSQQILHVISFIQNKLKQEKNTPFFRQR